MANGSVFVSSGSSLYALKADTGAILWQIGDPAADEYYQPTVVKGVVYIGYRNRPLSSSRFRAFRASDGQQLWGVVTNNNTTVNLGLVRTAAAVANGVVYGNAGQNLIAFNAGNGALLWSASGPFDPTSPTIASGLVFMSGGVFPAGQLKIFDAASGALLKASPGEGFHTVANGMVFVREILPNNARSLRALRLPKSLLP